MTALKIEKYELKRSKLVISLAALLALVISIGLAFATLSQEPTESSSKLCKTNEMTSACAHNPISHLRLRPDRDVLPTNVVPVNYDLSIKPDMDNFTFEGKVSIA